MCMQAWTPGSGRKTHQPHLEAGSQHGLSQNLLVIKVLFSGPQLVESMAEGTRCCERALSALLLQARSWGGMHMVA